MSASVSNTSAILAAGFGAVGPTAPGAAGSQKGEAVVGFEALLGAMLGETQPGQAAPTGAPKTEAGKDGEVATEDAPKDGKKLASNTPAEDPAQPAAATPAALFGMMAAPTVQAATVPTVQTAATDTSSSTPAQGAATPPDTTVAGQGKVTPVAPGLAQALMDGTTPADAVATDASALQAAVPAVATPTAQPAILPQPKAAPAAVRTGADTPKAAPAQAAPEGAPAATPGAAPAPADTPTPMQAAIAATTTAPPAVQAAEAAAIPVAAKAPIAKDEPKDAAKVDASEGLAGARKAATPSAHGAAPPTKATADATQQDLTAKPEARTEAGDADATTDTAQASGAPAPAAASQTHSATVAGVRGTPETVAHLAAQIVKKLDGRSTRFDVALDPIGLGHVDVRIEIGAHGRMSASMSCDNPQAAAELRARAGELQRALEQAGLDVSGGLSFDVASDQGRQNGRNLQQDDSGAAFRGRAFQAALETGDAADAATANITYSRRASSGVDVRI